MERKLTDYIIRNFIKKFGDEGTSDYRYAGPNQMIYKDKDGENLYDDISGTVRFLPRDPNKMTEYEYRFEFARRLKTAMRSRGVTQRMLSWDTGISEQMLSLYMTCKSTPSGYHIDKIAKALNCSADDFRYFKE